MAGCDGLGRVERIVHLEIVVRSFVEAEYLNRIAGFGIVRRQTTEMAPEETMMPPQASSVKLLDKSLCSASVDNASSLGVV